MRKEIYSNLRADFNSQISLVGAKFGPVTGMKCRISISSNQIQESVSIPKVKRQDVDKYILDVLTAYYYLRDARNAKIEMSVFTASGKEYSTSREINNEDGKVADPEWLTFVSSKTDVEKFDLTSKIKCLIGLPINTLRVAIGVYCDEDWSFNNTKIAEAKTADGEDETGTTLP